MHFKSCSGTSISNLLIGLILEGLSICFDPKHTLTLFITKCHENSPVTVWCMKLVKGGFGCNGTCGTDWCGYGWGGGVMGHMDLNRELTRRSRDLNLQVSPHFSASFEYINNSVIIISQIFLSYCTTCYGIKQCVLNQIQTMYNDARLGHPYGCCSKH